MCLLALVLGLGCADGSPAPGGDGGDGGTVWPDPLRILDQVRVVDADGPRADQAVLISHGRIWDVRGAGGDWPDHAVVEDWQGHSVVPGLIDSHVHLFHSGSTWWVGATLEANLRAQLAWGVVGVADLGSPTEVFDLRDRVAAGELAGPRIWATGPFLTAVGSHPCESWNDPSLCRFVDGDGAAAVAELWRADGIKLAQTDGSVWGETEPALAADDLADILAAATAAGQPVWAHVDGPDDAILVADAGASVQAHVVFEATESAGTALPLISTTGAFSGVPELVDGGLLADDLQHTPDAVVDAWTWLAANPDAFADGWIDAHRAWTLTGNGNLATAIEANRPVLAGSDAGYWFVPHGLGLHRELAALVDQGMDPVAALASATALPAQTLGWSDLGAIQPGMRAELLIVSGDPSTDIRALRDIQRVVLAGEDWSGALDRETWAGGLCLDDEDCAGGTRCDQVSQTCGAACSPTWDRHGSCDAESFCMPSDGLDASTGVCHGGDACDLLDQDCAPGHYGANCVPVDTDTNRCWPSGPRTHGQSCSWTDPSLYCEQGAFCSWVDHRCYALCDPDSPSACPGCTQQSVDGQPWFGICPD